MPNFARIRTRCDRIIDALKPTPREHPGINGVPAREMARRSDEQADSRVAQERERETRRRPIVFTKREDAGDENGGCEVMRGDVLIIDFEELHADPDGYGNDTIAELARIHAHEDLIAQVKAAVLDGKSDAEWFEERDQRVREEARDA